MTIPTRNELLKELLPGLEKLFGIAYEKYRPPEYVKRHRYGKYSIYRWDYDNPLGERRSTTIATGLDDATAKGMMKLLEEPK
jgi:endo-1,4-beta-mannosidase